MTTRSTNDLQAEVQRQRTRQHFEWQKHVAARRDLKPAAKLILLRLALFRNLETDRCDPSYGTLAKGAGVSDRTAIRAIEQAERLGPDLHQPDDRRAPREYQFILLPHARRGVSGVTPTGDKTGRNG
jgi:hypothetical protein